ncbi:MAG TPA: hypothetical protein VGL63_05160 [Streptosporangiaceae bacterium]|jgi:hypothetical protein
MTDPLVFGVFPLVMAGGVAKGPPDDFEAIGRALAELQGDGNPLLPRMYVVWTGPASTAAVHAQVAQLAGIGVPLDLALCYRDPGGDVAGLGRVRVAGRDPARPRVRRVPGDR